MNAGKLDPKVAAALAHYDLAYEAIDCDPELADTAAFCEQYGYSLSESANAILVASKKVEPTQYALCIVLATTRLDVNKTVCAELGVKKASFADAETTKAITGMMIGGVTAPGVKDIPLLIDANVIEQPRVVMGGGNRSSKLILDPKELLKLPNARAVENLANMPQ